MVQQTRRPSEFDLVAKIKESRANKARLEKERELDDRKTKLMINVGKKHGN